MANGCLSLNKAVSRWHTALCRCADITFTWTAHRHIWTLSLAYLEKYAFSLVHCIKQNVHGIGSFWSWFYVNWYIFREGAKNDFRAVAPVTLTFDPLTLKLLCQLFLAWITAALSLNIVSLPFSSWQWARDRQTDEQTDGL